MSFANKHNPESLKFNFEPGEDCPYTSLKEVYKDSKKGHIFLVKGVYTSDKGKFGPSANVATESFRANVPSHMVETIKEILADEEDIAAINAGKVGFKVYTYKNEYGTQYGLEWVDL